MNAFFVIVRRDLTLALRRASDTISVVLFFVLAIVLFPLGIGPELNVLSRIAAGTISRVASCQRSIHPTVRSGDRLRRRGRPVRAAPRRRGPSGLRGRGCHRKSQFNSCQRLVW